ncbi:MAG: inner membrane CreD family protein [Candidatus Hydrogenedentes bacterium]|nr:inner membrane CreD family protein [Candidatus Hydrogenedentota bacterium]
MSIWRIAAVGAIFVLACAGWWTLGVTTTMRSNEFGGRLGDQVEALWGVPLVQKAPALSVQIPGSDQVRWIMPVSNDVQVKLTTEYRKKGLIWYPTYWCDFSGEYTVLNDTQVAQKVRLHFDFPDPEGTYDAFEMVLDEKKLSTTINTREGVNELIEQQPGQTTKFRVTYRTRGTSTWHYELDPNAGRVQNLRLAVNTNFRDVDYPEGCLSPMDAQASDEGMLLIWDASDLITREKIGVIIPEKLNPGPLTSRITFFAPVCLVFFFVLVATIGILYKINIHPMHYLFVAAGFFAFHLLLAYMVGLIWIHVSFLVSAAVSVGLVTGYLYAALRGRFPWKIAIAGQLFFLVLFSYTFFLEGVTGLTVAIGSVVTLAILMKVTAHLDWDEVFARNRKTVTPPPPLPAPEPPAA